MNPCRSDRSPRALALQRAFLLSVGFCLAVGASSCGGGDAGGKAVTWPELAHFDELAYRADGFARVGDYASVEEARAELLEAGRAITPATTPSNAADPDQVETTLADLTSLIDGLAATELDRETMAALVLGLHPVLEKLMSAAGMPHVHASEGPNSGFRFPVFDADGKQVGTAEVKLHDDAGDIEVWLTQGGHGGEPWRLPVDTTLPLRFTDLDKTVMLAVRDQERNENESGEATIVDGATDYFVFPGDTGADASWLTGAEFAAKATLDVDGSTTGSIVLRPHVHHDNGTSP